MAKICSPIILYATFYYSFQCRFLIMHAVSKLREYNFQLLKGTEIML